MQKWQPCIIQSSVKYKKWIIQHCLLLHSQLSQPSVHRRLLLTVRLREYGVYDRGVPEYGVLEILHFHNPFCS